MIRPATSAGSKTSVFDSAKKIQSILGHSTISMTMDVYGHLFESPEDDVEMFTKLEKELLAA